MHDWSRHSILSQSGVPLYEKYSTVISALGSAHDNSGYGGRITRRSTLLNLTLFAPPNLIFRTKLIQTPLFCRT